MVLSSKLVLPQARASTGSSLAECETYITSQVWGGIHTADVKIAGETALAIPIQIIGDPSIPSVPSSCGKGSSVTDTRDELRRQRACGDQSARRRLRLFCAQTPLSRPVILVHQHGMRPVACRLRTRCQTRSRFSRRTTTGRSFRLLPRVPRRRAHHHSPDRLSLASGPRRTMLSERDGPHDRREWDLTTVFNGQSLTGSYFDTGTSEYSFADSSIAQCGANDFWSGSYCPASPWTSRPSTEGLMAPRRALRLLSQMPTT